jgi:hypothetical protein
LRPQLAPKMVFPLAAIGAFLRESAAYIGIAAGVGAVAVAAPELMASDQRGARELDDPVMLDEQAAAGQPLNNSLTRHGSTDVAKRD